jgi:hypothetical protein
METATKTPLITDEQSLVAATSRFGRQIRVYDDGFGSLYIHRDSMGISGIVRAQTWEDAYAICEDEFFPAGDEEAGEEMQRIEAMPDGDEKRHVQACWDEQYGFRGNSRKESDGSLSSIYAKDLNGDALDLLTPKLLAELEARARTVSDENDANEIVVRLAMLPSAFADNKDDKGVVRFSAEKLNGWVAEATASEDEAAKLETLDTPEKIQARIAELQAA